MKIVRRSFLKAFAVAVGGASTACSDETADTPLEDLPGDPSQAPAGDGDETTDGLGSEEAALVDMTTFPFGVLAGDMETTSATSARAMLWTRCTKSVPLHVKVWEEANTASSFESEVPIGDGGFVHFDASTLQPGKRYRYKFFMKNPDGSNAGESTTGGFTTPPAPSALAVFTFGAISCTHQAGPEGFQAAGKVAGRKLDAFFHLGDHVYNDSRAWLTTLPDFRDSWKTCFDLKYMRGMHANQGVYFTWDDHEIINNWDWDWVNANPVYKASVEHGTKTYFEHHPIRRDANAPERLWRSVKWGKTAELFILDLRSERREDVNRRIMSREQMTWLKKALAGSTAIFKFIMNPIPVCTMPPSDTHVADRWEGFDAERTELLAWIRDLHIKGVWWISGDYHVGAVGQIDEYGYRWYGMREIMMGPGAGHGAEETAAMAAHKDGTIGENQWPFATDASNFVVLTADPTARTLNVQLIDGAGAVIHDKTYAADDHLPPGRVVGAALAVKHAEKKAVLGEPLTQAHATREGTGTWQQFQYGFIFSHPSTGAHEIHGAILDHWANAGWSLSTLGYPLTDEYTTAAGDKEQEFQNGWITWNSVTGAVSTRAR